MSESVNIVEEILNGRKLDQWEIFLQKSSSFLVQTKQSETDFVQKAELSGLAVRLIKNQRMGFSFSSNLDYSSLKKTVDMAESVAEVTSEDPDYGFTVHQNQYRLQIYFFVLRSKRPVNLKKFQ